MLFNPIFSTHRKTTIASFLYVHWRAQADFLRARLFARLGRLDSFDAILPNLLPGRCYLGTRHISVAQITGSVGRSADFGRNFYPLKSHLRNRWVRVYLLSQQAGWPPIRVYKVGEQYFVVDGHHRVSVARTLGMRSIQAEVWEYQQKPVAWENSCWCCSPA
jgi:hypothetical protein